MNVDPLISGIDLDLCNIELAAQHKKFFPREIEAMLQLHIVVTDYLQGNSRSPEEAYEQLGRGYKRLSRRSQLFEAIWQTITEETKIPPSETRELSLNKEYRHRMYKEYGELIASIPEQRLPYFYSITAQT